METNTGKIVRKTDLRCLLRYIRLIFVRMFMCDYSKNCFKEILKLAFLFRMTTLSNGNCRACGENEIGEKAFQVTESMLKLLKR